MEKNQIAKNLIQLVKAFPECAENYNRLAMAYWVMFDGIISFDDVDKATPVETITRYFRKLVELGMVRVPDRVANVRKERERLFKSELTQLA